ncbi:MAG TPA: hypothetical protein VK034_27325, partial [Enhygromyxa sp.]|nr:hypothetical protein [Enhygromyxa sp.]
MRMAVRSRLACWLIAAGLIAACGKEPGTAAAPHPEPKGDPTSTDSTQPSGGDESGEDQDSRLSLEAEFHRTRFGLGTGLWVLGVVHNPHADRVTDVRMRVTLL